MSRIKAVIFDYGKVLSLPPTTEQWERLRAFFGVPMERFQELYWGGARDAYDRKELTAIDYWQGIAKGSGTELSPVQVQKLSQLDNDQWTNENPEMLEFARDLRSAGIKTAVLSNMQQDMLAVMRAKFPWLNDFDVQIYSCEVGMVKPDAEIYLECCRRLGVAPAEALFLDDKQVNTDAAKEAGLQAFIYHSAQDAIMKTGESEITVPQLRERVLGPVSAGS